MVQDKEKSYGRRVRKSVKSCMTISNSLPFSDSQLSFFNGEIICEGTKMSLLKR